MTGQVSSSHRGTWLKSGMENIRYEDHAGEHSRDVYQSFKNTLRPHSLLSPVEDRSKEVTSESSSYEKSKTAPVSLSELCERLRDRITQKSQLYSICDEDQQALTEVLTAELSLIWQDLKAPFVDTTLTQEEKVWLRSQVFCEVLHICEELLLQYLLLMDTFRRRGIFTDYANRSRLAAQLASDCTNLLNVRSIRCRIVSGIKATRRVPSGAEGSREEPQRNMLTSPYERDLHVKHCLTNTPCEKTVAEDLKEIEENIRDLDLQSVYDLLPCHAEPLTYKTDTSFKASLSSIQTQEKSHYPNQHVRIKGCRSMPDLQRDTLLEELEIAPPSRSPSLLVLLSTESSSSLDDHINPTEDLKRLLADSDCEHNADFETDLSSVIKASSSRASNRLQKLRQRLQKMEEEEKEEKKKKDLAEKPPYPQGANVCVVVSPQMFVQIPTARVSDRVLQENIKLKMYPPVYNPFTKEIDWASFIQMDQNLVEENIGLKEVFEELSKSISTKYFNFDEDPIFEPVPTKATFCLKRSDNKHLFNPSLMNPNPYSISHRERMERAANRKRPVDVTTRAYRAWFKWWTCQLSLDDYLDYISSQDCDYLSVIFHLYDSDDDDEEEERQRLTRQKEERRRRRQERIDSLRKEKQEYVPGFWNVNTIEMGGLGKDPEPEEENPDEQTQEVVDEGPAAGLLVGEHVQDRLERVWKDLCLPEGQRLDMAIKYSSHEYRDHLQESIGLWEQAAQLIHQRELLLFKLEEFERDASDPKRFFQQGHHGSSIARMEEASRREKINSRISVVDKELAKTIDHISTRFNDIITYKGRPYRDKMRWDRVEMLYWLQQERRVQSLERFVQGQTVLPARLPPLHHHQEPEPQNPAGLSNI